MNDYWIPITIAICLTLIALCRLWFDLLHKKQVQTTIRKALDKNEPLSLDVLESIKSSRDAKSIDLRRGSLLLALGISVIIASALLNFINVGLAIAAFPMTLAVGFLILWKIEPSE